MICTKEVSFESILDPYHDALAGRLFRVSSYDISRFHHAACQSYDFLQERVWIITFFSEFGAAVRSRELVYVYHECQTSQMLP